MNALADRDVEAAVQLFQEDAIIAAFPGAVCQGRPSIRTFFSGLFSLDLVIEYEGKDLFEGEHVALFTSKWTVAGEPPHEVSIPKTNYQAVVLRKQGDGSWLIAIDNPFAPTEP
jgi:uncharacterized protein (TIGR02246 family)